MNIINAFALFFKAFKLILAIFMPKIIVF